ncbi:MAG: hypothetical protein L3K11_05525 [Thermoplasmata archaeon]|nr:hypothetical protein [Thermoplasmata archaeon]
MAVPTWPGKALKVLLPVTGLLLVVQYIAGLWTNAYAPAGGFSSNSSFPALDLHWTLGQVLGVLSIILVVVALFSRRVDFVVPAIVILASVIVAGLAGMAFVSSTPNPPSATVEMGVAFLVAFATTVSFGMRLRWVPSSTPPAVPGTTASSA